MEYEKLKTIIKDMENSKLSSLSIDFPDGTKISMTKENEKPKPKPEPEPKPEVEQKEVKMEEKDCNVITSPMVGNFYSKPSPDAEPFVTVGTNVKKGDTVCIIEAMKLMNEIETEYTGTILEVLAKDGEAVEYGTPLFRIKK